jgi:endoglucanase
MNLTVKFSLTLGIILLGTLVSAQGLKTSGKKIIDENNNEVILRGMGLGGWMIQEGYMMETSNFAGPQREIKAKIESLIGPVYTAEFYKTWHLNHCTKGDIDSLASWGFNSVRLPMHYNLFTLPIEDEPVADSNTWLDEGFALTDSLVKWCSARHVYLILDLHAAPGGQGRDASISDYDPSKPSLWESDANKHKTIALWRKLADRYSNEPWIGGYDLINETNWNFTSGANQNGCDENSNAPLRKLLIDITKAIREVDTKHIIFIEGNCWANNYNGILPAWDNNMVVSFHKYWNYNDQGSIQGMLNLRNTYNIPLWLGESGENSNQWFTDAIHLLESNSIGWAWWPLKKVNSIVNPFTIPKNDGYQALLNYWQNGGTQPSPDFARNALMQLAQNARIENCIFRKDVIDAMFRQVFDSTAKPYIHQVIPGTIHTSDFDLGRNGIAFYDTDIATYHSNTGTYTAWNSGWTYRNDGVDVENAYDLDPESNTFNVGWTKDNEWMQYTVDVDSSAVYAVKIRYACSSSKGSSIRLRCNGTDLTGSLSLPTTGGDKTWKYLSVNDVVLYKGKQKITLYIEKGGANLGFLKFDISKKLTDMSLLPVSAETYKETGLLLVTLNKLMDPSSISNVGFSCTVNGNPVQVTNISINSQDPFQVFLGIDQQVYDGDDIKLSYSGGQILSVDGKPLVDFTDLLVKNTLPAHYLIPGKIEAEAFTYNYGLQLETTTDTGGGQDVGYTNTGDYLVYDIRVKKNASYTLEVRVACLSAAGILEFQQIDSAGTVLHSAEVDVPVTGGWQKWTTVKSSLSLDAGISKLIVQIIRPEFNINWYKFTEIIPDTSITINKEVRVYPNPVKNELKVDIPDSKGSRKSLAIYSMNNQLIRKFELASVEETYQLDIHYLATGFYIVELVIDDSSQRSKLLVLKP